MKHVDVSSITIRKGALRLFTGVGYTCVPFHRSGMTRVCRNMDTLLPTRFAGCGLRVHAGGHDVRRLIPRILHDGGSGGAGAFGPITSGPLIASVSTPCAPAGNLRGQRVTL